MKSYHILRDFENKMESLVGEIKLNDDVAEKVAQAFTMGISIKICPKVNTETKEIIAWGLIGSPLPIQKRE